MRISRKSLQTLSLFTNFPRFFAKKNLKSIPSEPYIVQPPAEPKIKTADFEIKIQKKDKKALATQEPQPQKPIPTSPYLNALPVSNPKIGKRYRWCACGMSLSQPFCDGSHEGSEFRPVRFVIEEETPKIELCGCKFSKTAPFCDKETCGQLKATNGVAKTSEELNKKP